MISPVFVIRLLWDAAEILTDPVRHNNGISVQDLDDVQIFCTFTASEMASKGS